MFRTRFKREYQKQMNAQIAINKDQIGINKTQIEAYNDLKDTCQTLNLANQSLIRSMDRIMDMSRAQEKVITDHQERIAELESRNLPALPGEQPRH